MCLTKFEIHIIMLNLLNGLWINEKYSGMLLNALKVWLSSGAEYGSQR